MDSDTRSTPARGVRTALRLGGTAIVAIVALGLTPAVADASPRRPSNGEIARAQATANGVAHSIEQLAGSLAAAQTKVDDAHAASAIALDDYQSTQAAYQEARTRADAAKAAAAKATAQLGWPAANVIAFGGAATCRAAPIRAPRR